MVKAVIEKLVQRSPETLQQVFQKLRLQMIKNSPAFSLAAPTSALQPKLPTAFPWNTFCFITI